MQRQRTWQAGFDGGQQQQQQQQPLLSLPQQPQLSSDDDDAAAVSDDAVATPLAHALPAVPVSPETTTDTATAAAATAAAEAAVATAATEPLLGQSPFAAAAASPDLSKPWEHAMTGLQHSRVLRVSAVDPNACTADILAALFGCYGDVTRVRMPQATVASVAATTEAGSAIGDEEEQEQEEHGEGEASSSSLSSSSFSSSSSSSSSSAEEEEVEDAAALVQFAHPAMAFFARQFLDGCPLAGSHLRVAACPPGPSHADYEISPGDPTAADFSSGGGSHLQEHVTDGLHRFAHTTSPGEEDYQVRPPLCFPRMWNCYLGRPFWLTLVLF